MHMRYVVSSFLLQTAQQQNQVTQEVARQTDGMLLAVGGLSSVLKKKVCQHHQTSLSTAHVSLCSLAAAHLLDKQNTIDPLHDDVQVIKLKSCSVVLRLLHALSTDDDLMCRSLTSISWRGCC